jgi:aryl-alcohol dehydrogenase-like predicted oxidoreductase
MDDKLSRRHFIGAAVATSAVGCSSDEPSEPIASAQHPKIPSRPLGKTGENPSILALGCGSRLLMYEDEEKGVEAINKAIDLGITYLDSAQAYGNGQSETWVGKVMKHRRGEVFLSTKIRLRGYDEAMREVEQSLKRLQTDQIDLIHVHNLWDDDDLKAAEEGCLKVIMEMRDQGVCRFAGVTSHTYPDTLAKALARHDFDCTQMALNAAMQGRSTEGKNLPPVPSDSFEKVALPVALEKGMGILAMKVTAQDNLVGAGEGKAGMDRLLRYTLSLPVSAAVVGMPKIEYLLENVQLAQNFQPMPAKEMNEFSSQMADAHKLAMDHYFCCDEDT